MVLFDEMEITGMALAAAGAMVTFVLPRFGRQRSPELVSGIKAAGLALAGAGALLILI